MPPWVITQLESWKAIIEAIEEQLRKIEAELRAAAPRKLIFGEGELTHELLARELIDPSVSATAARWATTLDSARVKAPATSDDGWGRSPSTAIRACAA